VVPAGGIGSQIFNYFNGGVIAGITYTQGTNAALSGVTVKLMQGTTQIASMPTGSGGAYAFTVVAGAYTVVAQSTASGEILGTLNPLSAGLASGQNLGGLNFGYYIPGSIAGKVYLDSTGQPGIGGVTVTIAGCDANTATPVPATALTVADGTYSFGNLPAGCYKLSVPATASGANLSTTSPLTVNLTAGQNSTGNNFRL